MAVRLTPALTASTRRRQVTRLGFCAEGRPLEVPMRKLAALIFCLLCAQGTLVAAHLAR